MKNGWKERQRPNRLENQYQFGDYEELRGFLDRAAELSEREDFYPDMGFGKDYVNITIHMDEGETEIGDSQRKFAQELDALVTINAD